MSKPPFPPFRPLSPSVRRQSVKVLDLDLDLDLDPPPNRPADWDLTPSRLTFMYPLYLPPIDSTNTTTAARSCTAKEDSFVPFNPLQESGPTRPALKRSVLELIFGPYIYCKSATYEIVDQNARHPACKPVNSDLDWHWTGLHWLCDSPQTLPPKFADLVRRIPQDAHDAHPQEEAGWLAPPTHLRQTPPSSRHYLSLDSNERKQA
ncbi:hypothetical protein Landi51_10363 [Colletotrichum acutatum]